MTEWTQVPKGGGGGVLRNSSDKDDRRISFFGGGNFRFRDIFGRKILATICFGSLIKVGFFEYSKLIFLSIFRVISFNSPLDFFWRIFQQYKLRLRQIIVKCFLEIFMARKLGFLGVKFRSSGFVGFLFLPPFDHPCHLKSGVPPLESGHFGCLNR